MIFEDQFDCYHVGCPGCSLQEIKSSNYLQKGHSVVLMFDGVEDVQEAK